MPVRRRTDTRIGAMAWGCLMAFLVGGCQVPARPPICGDEGPCASRRGLCVGREVVLDSAVHLVCRPVATSAEAVEWAGSTTRRVAAELWYKRVLLPACAVLPPRPCEEPPGRAPEPGLKPAAIAIDLDGACALARLEALLENARGRIDVMMYLWEPDLVGWGLARRLARKAGELAAQGQPSPTVRVLVDRGGNLIHPSASLTKTKDVNAAVCWLAQQPHVEVIRTRGALTRFDHRKLVLIDGRLAWSGGRNFTLLSFFDWHDLSFTLRGPLVEELGQDYERSWQTAGGQPRPMSGNAPILSEEINAQARVVGTGPGRSDLAGALYDAVDRARHHVYIENPFFCDSVLLWKLACARRRGVDVRVVVAQTSDTLVHEHATPVMVNRMLRAGFRVYRHPGMTHVKAAAVDGTWLYLGTANFDGLSLAHNHELGLAVAGGPLVAEVEERLFEADMKAEWEVKKPLPVTPLDHAFDLLAGSVL